MNERLANSLAFISTGLCIGALMAMHHQQAKKISRLEAREPCFHSDVTDKMLHDHIHFHLTNGIVPRVLELERREKINDQLWEKHLESYGHVLKWMLEQEKRRPATNL